MAFMIAVIDAGSSSGGDSCHRCIGSSPLAIGICIAAVAPSVGDMKYRLRRRGNPRLPADECIGRC